MDGQADRRHRPPRRGLNAAAAAGLAIVVLQAAAVAWAASGLVLTFHRVARGTAITYSPSVESLARTVASLRAEGARFVTASTLIAALAEGGPPLVAIAFDDGDESVYHEALPLLRGLGVPATVFVITERIDRPGSLTRMQLDALLAAGWEVGSHGAAHAALTDLTPAGVARDLGEAAAALDAWFGPAPRCVAYPFGLHDARVRAAAAALHPCAFTTATGIVGAGSDPLALPRPVSSVLDGRGVGWRAASGADPVALAVSVALVGWVLPGTAAAGSGPAGTGAAGTGAAAAGAAGAPPASPPLRWQPTAWRLLGDGRYAVEADRGGVHEALAVRGGDWSVQAWRARVLPWGEPGEGGDGGAVSVARALGDLTVAGAWVAGEGPGAGIAVDLAARGEAWAWWTVGGGWRLGLEALIVDRVRLWAAWQPRAGRAAAEVRAALPVWPDEGYPLSLAVGHDQAPYVRLAARIGAHELGLAIDTRGRLSTGLLLRW